MGARRHWQKGTLAAPWKCCKVLFVLKKLSQVSVDEVFMHYFEKMSSASGSFAHRPHQGSVPGPRQGTSILETPLLPNLEKTCGHPWAYRHNKEPMTITCCTY